MKTCRYCLNPAVLLKFGDRGYPYPDRDFGPMWACTPCRAWIGCFPGTENATGGLANAELRAAKQQAQAAFAPLWQAKMKRDGCSRNQARKAGYQWLSREMGIPFNRTHIGFFSLDECRKVVEICNAIERKK